MREAAHGVFGANWEGPYRVRAIFWEGTYYLEDLDGKLIPRTWKSCAPYDKRRAPKFILVEAP